MSSSTTIARNRGKQGKKQGKTGESCNHIDTQMEMNESSKNLGKTQKKYRLLSYDELPNYMKDNEFILKYYRSEWPLKHALFSLFQWHNETINVWTHLIGFVLFVWLTIVNAAQVSEAVDLFGIFKTFPSKGLSTNTSHDSSNLFMFQDVTNLADLNHTSHAATARGADHAARWPFYVYLSGSMFCLLSSTICHLFCCHSHNLNVFLLRMDYTGITAMIITSFFPAMYYIFLCQPFYQIFYLSTISVMGACTIITLFSPSLSSGRCRSFRAILFVSMGLFGIIPAVHACVLNWENPRRNLTMAYEAAMALSYLIGTGFYVSRIPERWRPGWFDLAGHSHQIFHVFVVLGALAHYGAALVFMQYSDSVEC